jgi:Holliday junction resolvase
MAATPEKKVKNEVTKILKSVNAYYFYPVTGGFGSSGVPDIVACFNGRFIGIECKAGKNEPTALQIKNLKAIEFNGGISLVVNENNIDDVREVLDALND